MERPLLPTLSFSPRSSERVDKAIGPQAETCLLFNSGERLADMSDVEENNFEGRVNVREEIEEFFPRMWKINQDKRRLMKSIKDQKIKIEWGKKLNRRLVR